MPVNYSKWDNIGSSSDDEAAPAARAAPAPEPGAEPIADGFCSDALEGLVAADVFRAMRLRTTKPGLFEPAMPGAEYEIDERAGFVRQKVSFGPRTPLAGMPPRVTHIYVDEARGELRLVDAREDGTENDNEVVHALMRNPLRLAFPLRAASRERPSIFRTRRARVIGTSSGRARRRSATTRRCPNRSSRP